MTLMEPDVALTDFGLALESAWFAAWLYRRCPTGTPLRPWFIALFSALGLAALLGGTIHGFFADAQSRLYRPVWSATLLAVGVAALAGWGIGARLLLSPTAASRVTAVAGAVFAGYVAVVLLISQSFAVAVVHYLPAAAFLLAAFAFAYVRRRDGFLLPGIAGMALTFVAAWVQQSETSLNPAYFNHNALYHLIQALALLLIFLTARGLLRPASSVERA